MGVERREAGRWIREDQASGTETGGSAISG
jgi:hypothetical protein